MSEKLANQDNANINIKPLFIIVVCALLVQIIGHYFARHYWVFNSFMAMWPILRIVLPVCLLLILTIPLAELSFGLPKFDKTSSYVTLALLVCLALLVIFFAYFADDYLAYYRQGMSIEVLRQSDRFERFMVFTVSTVIAWEIFHRGFLLGALRYCFVNHLMVSKVAASIIAMLFIAAFESLFHLTKPIYESLPFVFASLVLTWLTIRTRSLWPALLIHFALEVLFGYSAYVGW